jgi:hypothetical protein
MLCQNPGALVAYWIASIPIPKKRSKLAAPLSVSQIRS